MQSQVFDLYIFFFFQAEDGIRDADVTGVQTCALPISTNTADGSVPGAPNWHLAPSSMKWEGLTKQQICEEMKDPARNGGRRTGKAVIEHMKVDPLVLWAWTPGAGRTTPPISHEQFVRELEASVKTGMPGTETTNSRRSLQ